MSKYLFILLSLMALCSCQASKENQSPTTETKELSTPPLTRSESPGLELPQEVATPTVTISATVTPSPIFTPEPTPTPSPTPIVSQRSLRLESLNAMEKAPSFPLKLLHAYRYFGAFDFEQANVVELFSTLKRYKQSENYDALSLGVTSKILVFLKDHLQTEFEKDYFSFLDVRYQLSVKEALKILSSNDEAKGLFSWKPRYLKKKNEMTLQECEEVKRLFINALAVKKLAPQLELDSSVSKRLKQMNQELPESEIFKKEAQDIIELVQELLNDL